MSIWGISATIGNLEEAKEVLLSPLVNEDASFGKIIRAKQKKKVLIESVIPDEIEKYPWAGHLGIRLAAKVLPIIEPVSYTHLDVYKRQELSLTVSRKLSVRPTELSASLLMKAAPPGSALVVYPPARIVANLGKIRVGEVVAGKVSQFGPPLSLIHI